MRPFSFTKNIGGFRQARAAIKAGYSPGVTVKEFRARCELGDQALLVTEYLLAAKVDGNDEYVIGDSLIEQTISQPFSRLTARLYFFSVNLNMPGERRDTDACEWGEMQNVLMRDELFVDGGFSEAHFRKEHIERVVGAYFPFESSALRKWVTNYSYMAQQCEFVTTPSGRLETFPDTWGPLALRLFFERYLATKPTADANELVDAAYAKELHKLIGVPKSWLDGRVVGAAAMFFDDQGYILMGSQEETGERQSARRGAAPPPLGKEALRREALIKQIVRRSDNVRFLRETYAGVCQFSGAKLIMPDGSFSVDCAHIRPLGSQHSGKDSIDNMLSLSPNMHRLFDCGCVRVDPQSLSIKLLHGNDLAHLPQLLIRENHTIDRENLSYYLANILK